MAELLHNPGTLSKAREELEQTIGKGNPIEESDIAKLPYLQAIVKETFRLRPTVPLLLPHKVEADVENLKLVGSQSQRVHKFWSTHEPLAETQAYGTSGRAQVVMSLEGYSGVVMSLEYYRQ